jgi:predicted nucleic acid-binding protein
LNDFNVVWMLDLEIAVQAAHNYRALRSKGITIRKTVDLIIGTYCIEHRHTLLHAARDFEPMRMHLGLQVL